VHVSAAITVIFY